MSPIPDDARLKKARIAFRREGFTALPGFFSPARIAGIREQLDRLICDAVPSMPAAHVVYENPDDRSTLKQLQDLHHHSPYFDELLNTGELALLARTVLGEEATGKNVEYFNKPPRTGKATPPHQDAFYFNISPPEAVTMWLALEEADSSNGCVSYVAGSHNRGMRAHSRTGLSGFSQSIVDYGLPEDLACLRTVPAQPGDLLIHHAMTIHSAGPNRTPDRSRKALGFIYFARSAQPDTVARDAYLHALRTPLV